MTPSRKTFVPAPDGGSTDPSCHHMGRAGLGDRILRAATGLRP